MSDVVDSPAKEAPAAPAAMSAPDRLRLKALRAQALVIAFLIFVFDQAVKWVVTYPLNLRGQPEWTIKITDFFNFRWVENNGVSLNLLSASSFWGRWLLVLLPVRSRSSSPSGCGGSASALNRLRSAWC